MTYERWVARTERPLLLAAVVFLVVLCMPVIEPNLSPAGDVTVRLLNYGIWALFAVDYLVQMRLVTDRRRFFRTHLPDLAVVLLPALRPLRLLRLLSVGRVLARRGSSAIVADVTRFVVAAGALLIFLGAVGVLDAERRAKGANITSFGDALWWAATTITTVGYGDRYPVTVQGRLVAAGLMLLGLALLGILTAAIAAGFVRHVSREPQIENTVTVEAGVLLDVLARLDRIEEHMQSLTDSRAGA